MQWYIVWWRTIDGLSQAMTRAKTELEARAKVEKHCGILSQGARRSTGYDLKFSKANHHHYIQVP